ncbi:MAG: SDR family oxidoreductase [Deltaproteobacteria bacterium]|nr:SDR family oxidoreductase [Deltaproteobacteria bacterium]
MSTSTATRVALVTGGAKGIGAATVGRFLKAGFQVAVIDRDAAALTDYCEGLGVARSAVLPVVCDVVDRPAVDRAVADTVKTFGRLDVVVNNAGANRAMRLEEHTDEDWDGLVRLNLTSAFYFIRAALPELRKHKGNVVNVSSMTGLVGQPKGAAYAAAKGGLIAFTRTLALEFGPEGIRINCVCPAGVDTPLMQSWARTQPDPAAVIRAQANMHLLGRLASSDEIANAIYYLASDEASFATGVIFEVEGGATLGYRRA